MLMEKQLLTAMKFLPKDEKIHIDYHCKYNEKEDRYEPEDESFYIIRLKKDDRMCDMEIHEDGDILCGYRDGKEYKILSPEPNKIKLTINQMVEFVSGQLSYNELE